MAKRTKKRWKPGMEEAYRLARSWPRGRASTLRKTQRLLRLQSA